MLLIFSKFVRNLDSFEITIKVDSPVSDRGQGMTNTVDFLRKTNVHLVDFNQSFTG